MEENLSNPQQISDKTLDSIAQKKNNKHETMLERLSNLHQSRLQQQVTSRKSDSNSSPSFESTKSFLDRFSETKRSIENELNRCRQVSDPKSKIHLKSNLEKVSIVISELEKLVAENSYFLPSYEVRSSLKTISDLKETLENVNSELLPKKKFAFKNKSVKKDERNMVNEPEIKPCDEILAEKSNFQVRDSPGFRNKEGVVLFKHFNDSKEGDFTLSDLDSCEVRLMGSSRAIFIYRLRNCRVFVGPVLGSILIEEVEGCTFMLASHQIRIHHAKNTSFYLRVRSRPIIEDCHGVRFAPYLLFYQGIEKDLGDANLDEETGNWANVDDFRWLRAVQSPNWSILPEEERLITIMWLYPPFGVKANVVNKFIDKALVFKPKLLILVFPKESERFDEKEAAYGLVWEDGEKLSDKSFFLPGSIDVNEKQIEEWNLKPPLLYLRSRSDWSANHKAIALKCGHISKEQKISNTEECHDEPEDSAEPMEDENHNDQVDSAEPKEEEPEDSDKLMEEDHNHRIDIVDQINGLPKENNGAEEPEEIVPEHNAAVEKNGHKDKYNREDHNK